MGEDRRSQFVTAMENREPVEYLRAHFHDFCTSQELFEFESGVHMSVLAYAIEHGCSAAYHGGERFDRDRLSFLVTECGANLNTHLLIRGYPRPSTGGRTHACEARSVARQDYSIEATPLSRAVFLLKQMSHYRTMIEPFVIHMIELGADPKVPLDHIVPQPETEADGIFNLLRGNSLLSVNLTHRDTDDVSFELAVMLLKQGAGFLPADNAPVLSIVSSAHWEFSWRMLMALAPFYSKSPAGLFCTRDISLAIPHDGMLHMLARHVPNRPQLAAELLRLLVHVYGLSPLALNAQGHTPMQVMD